MMMMMMMIIDPDPSSEWATKNRMSKRLQIIMNEKSATNFLFILEKCQVSVFSALIQQLFLILR